MALQRPVILMRPGEANNRLAGVLLKEGIECWRWPAFRIELPGKEDCDLVQERLDNLDDVESMATFAASLGNIDRVDVLPFHQMGEHKWRELGLNYKLAGKPTPTPEAVDRVRKTFRAAGLLVS